MNPTVGEKIKTAHKSFKTQMLYLSPLAIAELAFPFLIRDTGTGMLLLLLVLPLLIFAASLMYGKKHGFSWSFSALVAFIWLPNLAKLNTTAAVYILIFGVVSYIGQFVGALFGRGRIF